MKDRIRIKDIAAKAGVSTGTVDRVIHDRGNVSETKRRKVLAVMDELGYERNIIASTLAYNRRFHIAALLPDFRTDPYWRQPKLGVEKAQRALQHYGVTVDFFFFDLFDPRSFAEQGRKLWKGRPDAILLAPVFLPEAQRLLREAEEREIPNVMINTRLENENTLCYIGQDSRQSGVLAARLLDLLLPENERILLLNLDREVSNAQHLIDKEAGFRDYFSQSRRNDIQIFKRDFAQFQDDRQLRDFLGEVMAEKDGVGGIFVTNSRANRVVQCLDNQ